MMPDDVVEINQTNAVFEVMNGEAIVINMATGSYYSLDGTAGALWELLAKGPGSSTTLARALHQAYTGDPATIKAEIAKFLDEMKTEGLVLDSKEAASTADVDSDKPRPYVTPVLNKYTDLEALLLLDPIHDVSPKGWPNTDPSGS